MTVNAIATSVGALIYKWILKDGERLTGIEGASLLLEQQMKGITMAVEAGIFVKINTVVIPGVNDHHINDITFFMAERNCFVHNIVPLIPRGQFLNIKKPDHDLMQGIRRRSESIMPVFSKCRQCRADAEGIPGKEGCCDNN